MLLLLLSRISRVQLCATPEMAAHQAPLSLGFSRQEHWSGLPLPSLKTIYINILLGELTVGVVQSLSHVQLCSWTLALQASLSFTISQSLLKVMSIESVMLSNYLILCHYLLLLPSISFCHYSLIHVL